MKTLQKTKFVVQVLSFVLAFFSLILTGCVSGALAKASEGISKAADNVLNHHSSPAKHRGKVKVSDSIVFTLKESTSFGAEYKALNFTHAELPFVYTIINPYTGESSAKYGICPRITVTLKSVDGGKIFSFFEYIGSYSTPVSTLPLCDRFLVRMSNKKDEPHKIKGFNSDGKCIYYFEFIPEGVEANGKGQNSSSNSGSQHKKPVVKVPKMMEPS
ncbi:MAG: hypothetical protein K9M11_03415 [Candidatus Pacebacteria bacterium]|nr:hypothetical protein [Candidatus Paceibacterota bacterium]